MPLLSPQPAVGVSNWKHEVMSRAMRIDQSLDLLIDNDYDTSSESSSFIVGTGTVTYDTGLTGGVARVKTGAGPLAAAIVYNAGGAFIVGNPLTESWYVQARCWIKNAPTGTTHFPCVTIQTDFGGASEWVTFGLDATYDATYLTLTQNRGGTVPTTSNVAADLTGFHDYGIGRDIVNDKLYALLDGTPILELDGPFANITASPCFIYSGVGATLLGQNVELWVDNIAAVVKRV